ncbi:MAG: OB-fold domain-containing protein [Desulfobacteraceae bacterium]|nr:OB-fold domain-containing protein [Desulfobacteraceae bacterium]
MQTMDTVEGKEPRLPDLFCWTDDGFRLKSAKCNDCGSYFFPGYHPQHRPGCKRENVEDVLLSPKGKLDTYTIQHYMCPPPFKTDHEIAPYGIGLVEFPEGIRIAGIIMETDLDSLELGMEMEVFDYPLYKDEDGNDVVTWAFRSVK